MTKKTKPEYSNKMSSLSEALENEILNDVEFAEEYLNEKGINVEELVKDSMSIFKKNVATIKQREGLKRQEAFKTKMIDFNKAIQGLNPTDVQDKFPALAQIAARKFDDGKFTQEEMDELMKDASFLSFLESDFDEESE